MSDLLIQWPAAKYWDKPWNPILGCHPCSPACDNCYAKASAKRFGMSFEPHPQNGKCPRKGVIFCGNMTDLFGEWVRVQGQFDWFSTLWHFPHRHGGPVPNDATYLFLTKRVGNMVKAVDNYTYMPHCYFGFTAENQEWFDNRIGDFRTVSPRKVNGWLSAEPLLGPIDLGLRYIAPEDQPFEWVVVGCESGPHRRPCKTEWVEAIVEQCQSTNIPVFVKQLDINGKCERDITKFPEHLRIRQVPWETKKEGV